MRAFRLVFDVSAFTVPFLVPEVLFVYLLIHLFYPAALGWPKELDKIPSAYGNVKM